MENKSTFKPFSVPYKKEESLTSQFLSMEKRLYVLEGRVKEIEACLLEEEEEETIDCDACTEDSVEQGGDLLVHLNKKKKY